MLYQRLKASMLLASGLFSIAVSVPLAAAPYEQLECAYEKMNASTMQAVIRLLRDDDPIRAKANENKLQRLIDPVVNGCAKRYGWNETDKENARRHYVSQGMQLLFSGILKYEKVQVDLVDAVYKAEPLTRAEMSVRMGEEAYRKELAEKIMALNIGAGNASKADLAVAYIELRLMSENLHADFAAGILRN